MPTGTILGTPTDPVDRTWSDAGGYVRGFSEVFDPTEFALDAGTIGRLDPVYQWVLHAARQALVEAGPHRGPVPAWSWVPLTAAAVVGTMPNVVANRLNAQLNLTGPGFTVSAEQASGTVALELAGRALRTGEADAAVVGAVDLPVGPVHQRALADLGQRCEPGDAAVVLVLKPLTEARQDGDPVIALLDEATGTVADPAGGGRPAGFDVGAGGFDPVELFGSAHAADGLLAVASAALALRHRIRPRAGAPALPDPNLSTVDVSVAPLGAAPGPDPAPHRW